MNNKKGIKKGVIGIALAAIMIASIFAVIAPTGADVHVMAGLGVEKQTYPDKTATYHVGDHVNYTIEVTNPDGTGTWIGNVYDIYPNGTNVTIWGDIEIGPESNKTTTIMDAYVVTKSDGINGSILNSVWAFGKTNGERANGWAEEESEIIVIRPVFEFDFNHTCCCRMEFDGSASYHPEPGRTIETHTWNFSDGNITGPLSGAPGVISHTYASCSKITSMTVTLSGYDDVGFPNSTTKIVYVPCPPTAIASASVKPPQIQSGETVTFFGYESKADENAPWLSIVNYTWTFDDGYDTQYTKNVTREVEGEPGTSVCGTLEVSDGHCSDTEMVCVWITKRPACRLRLYGTFDKGPGNHSVEDPETGLKPENPPYTDPIAPFYPQAKQAPDKDFVTFNPAIMDANQAPPDSDDLYDELDFVECDGGIVQIPKEKVFKRMWYEKEWFKDADKDGRWDVVIEKPDGTYVTTLHLDEEEAIHEQFTLGNRIREWNSPGPNPPGYPEYISAADIYGPAIKQEFTYMFLNDTTMPTMIMDGGEVLIPMAHDSNSPYRGLNSFDADGDGVRDPVMVKSEQTLGLDIDQNGRKDPMDRDNFELNGNESVVLVLGNESSSTSGKKLYVDELGKPSSLQFFDHVVALESVEQMMPQGKAWFKVCDNEGGGSQRCTEVGLKLDDVKYFYRGKSGGVGENTAFYLKLKSADHSTQSARIEVGRMFGQTHANIEANSYRSQKAFIVDEVFYNVVAIKTYDNCIKYITFRQKLPKMAIELFGKHLKVWGKDMTLPEMPPFNEPHWVMVDVQDTWTVPIQKIGDVEARPSLLITYVDEGIEVRYKGELKEIYNETINETIDESTGEEKEYWNLEWFWTYPWQYTEFELPANDTYLVTLSWIADQSDITIWNDVPGKPVANYTGERVKFWYKDCSGPLFIDKATSSIRLYGTFDAGPGDHGACDPEPGPSYGLKPENPPYTEPEAPFYPQHEQAPRKDFITFNPAIMDHNQNYEELDFVKCDGGIVQVPKEKVFKRMWYEKEWFKDSGETNGEWDVVVDIPEGPEIMTIDQWNDIPDFVKEIDKLSIREWNNEGSPGYESDADIYGPAIKQEFAYMFLDENTMPIMIRAGSEVLIPMAHNDSNPYRGLNSFDADGDPSYDGDRDALRVESERTLDLDIDQNGRKDQMDRDSKKLNGNESVVLVLGPKRLYAAGPSPDSIQFFDHVVTLESVEQMMPTGKAWFKVCDNEGGYPRCTDVGLTLDEEALFYRGKPGGVGENTTFYLKLKSADHSTQSARIEVGRMFGQTHANIEANAFRSQKAFIVDGVFYNVVAIRAQDDCIKYIVFREKLPKMPIKLFGKHLKVWSPGQYPLPEMPPFNEEHEIMVDVQTMWTRPYSQQDKIGPKETRPALNITYVEEGEEERFKGELKEIYNETCNNEFWMTEWFHTKPQQYTEFVLQPKAERYLVTLGWYAPESVIHIWDDDPDGPIVKKTGERVKFWYTPLDNTDIYVNRVGIAGEEEQTLKGYYDTLLYVGDGDGEIDIGEVIQAILDYLEEPPKYPFEPVGPFTVDDLIHYVLEYLD